MLHIGGAVIQGDMRIGQGSLRNEDIVRRVRRATEAAAVYCGRFPVERARVIVSQNEDKDESIHGMRGAMSRVCKVLPGCVLVLP